MRWLDASGSLAFLVVLPLLVACGGCRPAAEPETVAGTEEPAPAASRESGATCADGVALDDGSFETGYGFVPSAEWGIYLQRFDVPSLSGARVEEVCVCWLKTRGDQDADFEVLFYEENERKIAPEPYAVIPGRAEGLVTSKEEAGPFSPVSIEGVTLPDGPSWVGVRWNPKVENFLFVCADHGAEGVEEDPPVSVPVVFQEDRARGWADAQTSRDPIFGGHRAIGIRVRATAADGSR